jgi:DNA-damage-inducible protein J
MKQPRYNAETESAMREAERIALDPTVKGYTDLDEMFNDLSN